MMPLRFAVLALVSCAPVSCAPVAFASVAFAADPPTDVVWRAAPSFADLAAAYPVEAREKGLAGQVMLACVFVADSRLRNCSVEAESPRGVGFGAAAKALTDRFQGPERLPNGKPAAGVHARIAINFAPDMLQAPAVTRPAWLALPDAAAFQAAFPEAAAKAGVLKARVVIGCTVDAAGGLTACAPVSEDPPGYGFGAATLPLAQRFRLNLWGVDGRPVVGGTIRAPIRYQLEQAPAKP